MVDEEQGSPDLYKAQLGETLKRLREAADVRIEDAARVLSCTDRKIRMIERGDVGVRAAELRDLMSLYRVDEDDRSDIEHLATLAGRRRPRTPWGGVVPDRIRRFFNAEETAVAIQAYQPWLLHGLVQTERYARAVLTTNSALSAGEVERLVQARLARQDRLTSEHPPRVQLVVDERVLRAQVGGPEVMREQLEQLASLAAKNLVELRIIPTTIGAHAGSGFPFVLFTRSGGRTRLSYVETLTDGLFVDDPDRVATYERAMMEMIDVSLSPDASRSLLDTVASQL